MDSIEYKKKNISENKELVKNDNEEFLLTPENLLAEDEKFSLEILNTEQVFIQEDIKVKTIPESLGMSEAISGEIANSLHVQQRLEEVNLEEKTFKDKVVSVLKSAMASIKNIGGKIIERSVTPISYDPLKVLSMPGELLLPKLEAKTWATKNRYDAWAIYNGQPQKYESFRKNPDGTYKIKSFNIKKENFEKIINNPQEKQVIDINFGAVSGVSSAIKGSNEEGNFVDFVDDWDLQPLKTQRYLPNKIRNFEVSSLTGGSPFTTVNRVYYDKDGNLFDDDKTALVKTTESVTFYANEGRKTEDTTFYKTPNIKETSQNEVLHDWDKHSTYGLSKSIIVPAVAISAFLGHNVIRQNEIDQRMNEFSNKKKIPIEQVHKYFDEHPAEYDSLARYEDYVKNISEEP